MLFSEQTQRRMAETESKWKSKTCACDGRILEYAPIHILFHLRAEIEKLRFSLHFFPKMFRIEFISIWPILVNENLLFVCMHQSQGILAISFHSFFSLSL